ncbi:MAG TPA: hypothetical protein VN517_03780 [Terriglobales bacterium]|nr:hypothetical protein [Terriglobales bacterium]
MKPNPTTETEIEILAKHLRKQRANGGWQVVLTIGEVPEGIGHYALYDGLELRGAGVTKNMRDAIQDGSYYEKVDLPIYMFLPDTDDSAALWLRGEDDETDD